MSRREAGVEEFWRVVLSILWSEEEKACLHFFSRSEVGHDVLLLRKELAIQINNACDVLEEF
jgi:hypothetical protein